MPLVEYTDFHASGCKQFFHLTAYRPFGGKTVGTLQHENLCIHLASIGYFGYNMILFSLATLNMYYVITISSNFSNTSL